MSVRCQSLHEWCYYICYMRHGDLKLWILHPSLIKSRWSLAFLSHFPNFSLVVINVDIDFFSMACCCMCSITVWNVYVDKETFGLCLWWWLRPRPMSVWFEDIFVTKMWSCACSPCSSALVMCSSYMQQTLQTHQSSAVQDELVKWAFVF